MPFRDECGAAMVASCWCRGCAADLPRRHHVRGVHAGSVEEGSGKRWRAIPGCVWRCQRWRAVGAGNVQRICRRDIMSGGVHAGKCFPPCGHLPGFGMAS